MGNLVSHGSASGIRHVSSKHTNQDLTHNFSIQEISKIGNHDQTDRKQVWQVP